MKCDKIRNIIKTDYIDNELDDLSKAEIERHIDSCNECRRFLQELKNTSINPLRNLQPSEKPDYIWNLVRDRVERREAPRISLLIFPRLAYAVAIIFLFFTMGLFYHRFYKPDMTYESAGGYIEEHARLLADLSGSDSDSVNFDTRIERFFL